MSSKIPIIFSWFSAETLSRSVCNLQAFTKSLLERLIVIVCPGNCKTIYKCQEIPVQTLTLGGKNTTKKIPDRS